MPVAGRALARGGALDHLREADHGHDVVGADLAPVDLLEEVDGVLDPAELGVVVLDVARGQLPHPLDLDVVDHGREDLLARLVAVADGDPDQLAAAVLHALVAEPDRRRLAATLELVHEDRGVEVEHVHGCRGAAGRRRASVYEHGLGSQVRAAGPPAEQPPEQRPQEDRERDLDREREDVERLERVAQVETVHVSTASPHSRRVDQERATRSPLSRCTGAAPAGRGRRCARAAWSRRRPAGAWRGTGWRPRARCPASWARSAWVERTTTSAGSPVRAGRGRRDPVSTSSASTPATRLETFWKDCRAMRALASRSFSPRRRQQLHRDLGVLVQQPLQVARQDRDRAHVVDRLDGGGADLAAEHRQLAEDLARAQVGERDRAPVRVLAGDARLAPLEHVARVAGVALAQDDRARRVAARHRDARDLLQLGLRQLGEQRHAAQQLGGCAGRTS